MLEAAHRNEVDSRSAADRAYVLLRQAILDLTFLPGSFLSEAALVDQIGVSRTPIRQALQRLEQEQLIRIFPQRGSAVAPLNLQSFKEAFFIRLSLETSAACLAATMATTQDCKDLSEIVSAQRHVVQVGRSADFFPLNRKFHQRIIAMAGIPGVWSVVEAALVQVDRVRVAHLTLTDPYPLVPVIEEHAALVAALERHDPTGIEQIMREHLEKALPRVDLLRERRPDLFSWPAGLFSPTRLKPIRRK